MGAFGDGEKAGPLTIRSAAAAEMTELWFAIEFCIWASET